MCFPLLEDKQRVKFGGVISYTHFIPMFLIVFVSFFFYINECSNTLNVHLNDYVNHGMHMSEIGVKMKRKSLKIIKLRYIMQH